MFKVVSIESLLWPVLISVPKEDGSGEHDDHEIKVEYTTLDRDALEALSVGGELLGKPFDVRDYIVSWEQVFDDKGKSLKFTKSNLDMALKIPYIAKGVVAGFWLCQEGYAGKN